MTSHKHDSAPKCFHCRKVGHISKFCHNKKEARDRYKQRRDEGQLADANQNQDVRLFMAETALATQEDESDIWFIDFGASSHMTGKM